MTNETASTTVPTTIQVDSPNTVYTDDFITAKYSYENTRVEKEISADGEEVTLKVVPETTEYTFRTSRACPKKLG